MIADKVAWLRSLYDVAVASALPAHVLADHLPSKPKGRCIVIGAGKASALMAQALEHAWPDVSLGGLVVTRDGYAVPTERIRIMEAAHPVPDIRSFKAARAMRALLRDLSPDDLVLALVSGGGSATLVEPAPGLTLEDKVAVHRGLLASGAPIRDMNRVRSALSAVKGGGLARAAAPARVVTLVISDVPGDRPEEIASGPTLGMPASRRTALEIIERLKLPVPARVARFLAEPDEPPLPPTADVRVIAAPRMALAAAGRAAEAAGVRCMILGDALEGEAAEMGRVFGGIARSVVAHDLPVPPPVLLLSGGETTVTLSDGRAGRGGRNMEYLLSLALAVEGEAHIWGLAGDTDGIDGSEDAAGAWFTPDTLRLARARGIDPAAMLADHDSYSFFEAVDSLLVTGPTFTNVNDFRAILIA